MKRVLLAFACVSAAGSVGAGARTQPVLPSLATRADCGDLLARAGRKPQGLIFEGCAYLPDRQGKPIRATYRVAGAHAAAVETYLVRAARLGRLRRSCCQWDGRGGQFTVRGRDYLVSMSSEETSVASRRDWGKIDRFGVVVETFTEEI